ncbi:hypothetical protein IG631_01127 [Alternaria alternata]|nr:hypothetical protein IG631_01127 [Alternaria alternata]
MVFVRCYKDRQALRDAPTTSVRACSPFVSTATRCQELRGNKRGPPGSTVGSAQRYPSNL